MQGYRLAVGAVPSGTAGRPVLLGIRWWIWSVFGAASAALQEPTDAKEAVQRALSYEASGAERALPIERSVVLGSGYPGGGS